MLKTILVDDERPALRELEFMLKKFPEVSIAGMFTNPLKALEEIEQLQPDVVFLDINMPQLLGIDAASRILEISPDTDIVFVTAFDQYAIDAFELNALDYVLKPIDSDRFEKTMARLMKKKPPKEKDNKRLKISCFGKFEICWPNKEPIKWRSEKTKELFAYLLQNKGRDISKEELLDKLWTEDDPNKAIRHLYNGIYYIRKALEDYGVDRSIISIGSNYNFKLGELNLDEAQYIAFEKGNYPLDSEALEELADLYAGDYLESEYYPWADFVRERYLILYIQCLTLLAQKLMEKKQWRRAENYLLKAYNKNPYEQSIIEMLLSLYKESGDKSKAVKQYNDYCRLIMEELGIMPHEKLQKIIKAI